MYKISLVVLLLLASQTGVLAKDIECDEAATRYVFSWPLSEGCDDTPRGGTSRGADVTISTKPHAGWLSIQQSGLSKFEQDRAAILAMAGGYKVNFDFLETVGFSPNFKRDKPYNSWATEYVYVVENKPEFISLQHVMVMYFKQDDETVSEPFVMKHWRQDWTYQDNTLFEYDHRNTWRKVALATDDVTGKWSQAVFQVDDSPRYESIGQWQHNASFSTWLSSTTRRPLPRREFSARKDYQVLEGFNRHTVTRYGWLQEEENWKLVIDESGKVNKDNPYLSKELGVARYQVAGNVDFSPGDAYMKKTGTFWALVRSIWHDLIDENSKISLHKVVNGQPLFVPLFGHADQISKGASYNADVSKRFVQETLSEYIKK